MTFEAFLAFALKYWQWIAGAILVAGLIAFYNLHVHDLLEAQKQADEKDKIAALSGRDAQWQQQEAKERATAQAQAEAATMAHQNQVNLIVSQHEKDKADAAKTISSLNARIAAGERLRLNAAASDCQPAIHLPNASGNPGGVAAGSPAGFLGQSDSAFLVGEAARADQVTALLNECIRFIHAERK